MRHQRLLTSTLALAAAVALSGTGRVAPRPVVSDPGWLARAQQEIAQREYRVSPNAGELQAPNRAHALRTVFTPEGIRVRDRDAAGGELLALQLSGVGRGAALAPVTQGAVTSDGARVEIARPGVVEWFENSPAGLEQGFTLERRPVPGTDRWPWTSPSRAPARRYAATGSR
jgi:hypothetical protein